MRHVLLLFSSKLPVLGTHAQKSELSVMFDQVVGCLANGSMIANGAGFVLPNTSLLILLASISTLLPTPQTSMYDFE